MPSTSFAVLSDLHLETPAARPTYPRFSFKDDSPNLALLGDIGLVHDDRLFAFLEEQLARFEIVFYVLGNHEPYDSTWLATKATVEAFEHRVELEREARAMGKFVFLDQRRYDLTPQLTILGCTLFSAIDKAQTPSIELFVSDFERIQDWSIDSHNEAHKSDLEWLNQKVLEITENEPERRIAIFTHYSPTILPEANDSRHLQDDSGVRTAFMTDLSNVLCWRSPSVVMWAFGHTHFNCDFVDLVTGKRVVANQKGYKRAETHDFDPEKLVSLTIHPHDTRTRAKTEEKTADAQNREDNISAQKANQG